ncbi:MAG: ABC transporter ATP-binding protein [Salinirussus sp.]
MTSVSLRNVSVDFADVAALQSISIDVKEGEFYTLVGPSGCGKTTLLRTIAGFETPDTGTIEIGGTVVTAPPDQRNVGVVFQEYALFPHMSVSENVGYGLRYHDPPDGVSTAERVSNLLELVDMAEMADRAPDELSGGQRQRVALARALAPNPNVLLLDEPLSALDARLRERLRVVVREIQQDLGITTVYVTHDQAEALAISDRVAVMSDGRIEQVGTPEAVYREPATRFVAGFVGENNLLDGYVSDTDSPTISLGDPPNNVAIPIQTEPERTGSITISIRPEDIHIDESAPVSLSATVETVEFLGDAYRVHCDWNGVSLLAKVTAEEAPSGTVSLGIDPNHITVIDRP